MILGDFKRMSPPAALKHSYFWICLAVHRDSVSVGREAETGRHISFPSWRTLQGYKSQSAWARLSLTCYESMADWGWSITLGGGSWGERTARRGRGRPECVSIAEAALLPVTHHALLHDRQPCLACAQWEVRYSTVWAVPPRPPLLTAANTERPKGVKTPWMNITAVLYRPWKISRFETTRQWLCAPFPTERLILVFPVGFNSKASSDRDS